MLANKYKRNEHSADYVVLKEKIGVILIMHGLLCYSLERIEE
jgi:hypothetical protein